MENNNTVERNFLKITFITISIIVLLVISIFVGILVGSSKINIGIILGVLKNKIFGLNVENVPSSAFYIIWNLRFPRALLAIAAGGSLAVCGAAMQAVTQNVLADPYILGISSGASAMASIAFCYGGALGASKTGVSIFAFFGALGAVFFVYFVGNLGGAVTGTRLIMAGMAINVMLNAVSQLFITLSNEPTMRNISLWMMGSVAGARWDNILLPISVSLLGLLFFFANARAYNLISLGDESALIMGTDVKNLKKWTAIVVAFVIGVLVAVCGLIGLVGFVIPHIVRLLFGTNHRKLFPFCFLIGATFLVWMDMLARCIMPPTELPIGLFTAICAGPFFIWLLVKQSKGGR